MKQDFGPNVNNLMPILLFIFLGIVGLYALILGFVICPKLMMETHFVESSFLEFSRYFSLGCSLYRFCARRHWPAGRGRAAGGLAASWSDSASTSMSGLAARRGAVSPAEPPPQHTAKPLLSLTGQTTWAYWRLHVQITYMNEIKCFQNGCAL